MIEPVAGHDFTKEIEQPHIVYKRSPDDFQTATMQDLCNVISSTSRIIAKRALNLQKKPLTKSNETKSYTLELLVVLDKSLLDYCRKMSFDVENYILTLFNMASLKSFQNFLKVDLQQRFEEILFSQAAGLFHDVSLGVHMQLTIVRIIRLEVEENEVK